MSAAAFALAVAASVAIPESESASSLMTTDFISSFILLPASFSLLKALTIRNRTIAVQKKVIIALITAPQSKISASVTILPSASVTASRNTVCNAPVLSAPGIQFIKGFSMEFTKEFIIAVKALPIIMPTARSITEPRFINFLNSSKSFLIS